MTTYLTILAKYDKQGLGEVTMLKTLGQMKAQLAQYFVADESRDEALHRGLQQEQARLDAERAAILASDYPEHKAIRANAKAEIEAGWQRARAAAAATQMRPAGFLKLPTMTPSPPAAAPPSARDIEDVDAFLARMEAKYGPIA